MKYLTVNTHKEYSSSLDIVSSEVHYSSTSFMANISQILVSIDNAIVNNILGNYLKVNEIKDLIDVRKLTALLIWLKYVIGLKIIDVTIFKNPPFIEIDIDECGWEEWDIIARSVKSELINESLEDVAERVAIICPKALRS